jgi:hypothetical protein
MLTVVMLATFAALDSFGVATRANFSQNQAQSIARTAVDRLARELRSSGSPGLPSAPIERADANELVFLTVDPSGPGGGSNSTSVERVRYCTDNSSRLWKQVQTWTTASPPSTPPPNACPHNSFGSQSIAASYVANQSRAIFTYDSSNPATVGSVTVDLYIDIDVSRAPGEQRLSTTVFLRNQNRPPVATFTPTLTGSQHVLLNASGSADPDGDDVTYSWYDGSTLIGSGPLFDYASPTTGSHTFSVTVTDSTGLSTTSPTQTIAVS